MTTLSSTTSPFDNLRPTMRTLYFATAFCGTLLLARWAVAGVLHFTGFFGNLLLAWIPLALTFLIQKLETGKRGLFWACVLCWVLFFPNAHYIVTDMIHLKKFGSDGVPRWFDMMMTMTYACTGLFIGCLSLYLLQWLVRKRFSERIGWTFAVSMLALASFGIYLGRFVRLNSWDVVTRPAKLLGDLLSLAHPTKAPQVVAFSLTFFLFSLAGYCFFVSLTRLHERQVD